jgi:hypothetical protein
MQTLIVLILAGMVTAAEPVKRQFSSPSGTVVLRVSTNDDATAVTGTAARIDAATEHVIWEKPLAFVPEKAFVSNAGEVIAIQKIELNQNNYWQAREVPNAVAAYSASGDPIANYKLSEFTGHQELWDRLVGRSAKVFADTQSWTGSCQFQVDELHGQLLITPESGRAHRLDFKTGKKSFLPPGMQLQAPLLKIVGVSQADPEQLLVDAINPNDHPVSYHGYLRDSFSPDIPAGWIYPIYQIEQMVDGKAEVVNLGWCGTGRGEVTLPAMARQRFHVRLRDGVTADFRIGVGWESEQPDQPHRTVWTEMLSRDAIARLPKIAAE